MATQKRPVLHTIFFSILLIGLILSISALIIWIVNRPVGRIAFADSQNEVWDIYLINADGSEQTQLTHHLLGFKPPAFIGWSPNGKQLAVWKNISDAGIDDGNGLIYIVNADGSGSTQLTNTGDCPSWSPDSTRLAYRDNKVGLIITNADGSGQIRLENSFNGWQGNCPAWSPDGKRLAFVSLRNGKTETYISNSSGTEVTNLHNPDAYLLSWSPSNKQIAFTSFRDRTVNGITATGSAAIYVMNPDGTEQTPLTDITVSGIMPIWSPNGQQIAFLLVEDDQWVLYIMNANGSEKTLLSPVTLVTTFSWSPNGRHIVFTSDSNSTDRGEIYIINTNNRNKSRLTSGVLPTWQP